MMKRVGFASLSLLGSLTLAPRLHAQSAAPTPSPAEPAAAAPAAAPAPESAAPAAAAPAAVAPAPTAAAPAPAASASVNAELKSGEGYDVGDQVHDTGTGDDDGASERSWRAASLHLGSGLNGSTG